MNVAASQGDLDEALYGDGSDVEWAPEGWAPADRFEADRLLGRRNRVLAERSADRAAAEAQVSRVAGWLTGRLEIHDAELERLDGILNRYHAAVLEQDPRAKTLNLPNGILRARVGTLPTLEWVDEDTFVAWAQEHRVELVRESTTYAPARADAKKVLTIVTRDDETLAVIDPDLGELVPGVVAKPPSTTYSIDGPASE